jgi:chromosome segregation ATPase
MRLAGLPAEFEAFVERARAALSREIEGAKALVTAAHAEKSAAQNALSTLQAQCKQAQEQLKLTTSEFDKVTASLGIGRDIVKLRAELKKVKVETERATAALEKVTKEQTAREARVRTLDAEAQRFLALRSESEAVMADIRSRINSVQLIRQ